MAIRPDVCFSCERPSGGARACPYCGERIPQRQQRLIVAGTVFVLGIAVLLRAAVLAHPASARAATLRQLPAGTQVELSGVVVDTPYARAQGPRGPYLSFTLRDTSGTARIIAEGPVAAQIEAQQGPGRRDTVRVQGTLESGGGRLPRVRLHERDGLSIQTRGVRVDTLTMR